MSPFSDGEDVRTVGCSLENMISPIRRIYGIIDRDSTTARSWHHMVSLLRGCKKEHIHRTHDRGYTHCGRTHCSVIPSLHSGIRGLGRFFHGRLDAPPPITCMRRVARLSSRSLFSIAHCSPCSPTPLARPSNKLTPGALAIQPRQLRVSRLLHNVLHGVDDEPLLRRLRNLGHMKGRIVGCLD